MPDFVAGSRPAPSVIAGVRGPEQLNPSRVVVDMQDEILLWMPSASPLTVLTSKIRKKRRAHNYKFEFMEKDEYPRSLVLAADSIVGDTIIDVQAGQGARVAKNMVLLNVRTREHVLATATPAGDAITVARGIGGGELDMVTSDTLVITGAVFSDGDPKGDFKSIKEDALFNYTEIVRTGFGFTGRDIVTELFGGSDRMTETKWQGVEHLKSLEYRFFFGKRFDRTGSNNHRQSFTGGLEYYINSNVWDVTNTQLNERSWTEMLQDTMRWGRGGYLNGRSSKFLFASARWMTEIEFWAKDRIQMKTGESTMGLSIKEYTTTHGTIHLVHTPILDEYHADMAFLLDLNHIRYAYLNKRDTKLLDNREDNSVDGEEFEYFTDFGTQIEQESAHAILKGLQ